MDKIHCPGSVVLPKQQGSVFVFLLCIYRKLVSELVSNLVSSFCFVQGLSHTATASSIQLFPLFSFSRLK